MSERELLELSAKAAGIRGSYMSIWGEIGISADNPDGGMWNPLEDDGDSARLEATMCFHVEWHPATKTVRVGTASIGFTTSWGNDKQAARRLAGVLCAAEIGKAM